MMRVRSRSLGFFASILALVAFSCSQRQGQPAIGDRFPQNELCDLNGKKVTIPDDLRGKIVIIRFWQDCCSYNINEMSSVDEMFEKYEKKGVAVLTIHTGKPKRVAEDFVAMLRIRYPVLLDSSSRAAERCGVSVVPSTFILDRDGIVRAKMTGEGKRDYEKLIKALL
jgi:cytochrome c biogenesis protein CcmG, thiol:disulfide interchange protein DsbE